MNNCLVTKLKGVVNNSKLPFYNELRISFYNNETDGNRQIELRFASQVRILTTEGHTVRIVGDGIDTNITDYTVNAGIYNLYGQNANYDVILLTYDKVTDLYSLKNAKDWGMTVPYDMTHFINFNSGNNTNIKGKIKKLGSFNSLNFEDTSIDIDLNKLEFIPGGTLALAGEHVVGDINGLAESLASNPNSSMTIYIGKCQNITGEVSSFAERLKNLGKTSGTINLNAGYGTKLYYNNSIVNNAKIVFNNGDYSITTT